jgi:hypothetical protein
MALNWHQNFMIILGNQKGEYIEALCSKFGIRRIHWKSLRILSK